jgi:protein-tyrosine phosphatase
LVGRLGGRAAAAFDVSSAGVQALVGARVHPDTLDELNPWGLDRIATGRFVAQQLCSNMIEQADLVLGVNPRHRSAIVELVPTAVATAFSLREFARLAAAVDQEALPADPVPRAHALVAQAHRHREMVPEANPDEDQVPHSTSCPPAGPDHATVLISEALQAIVDVIAPRRR